MILTPYSVGLCRRVNNIKKMGNNGLTAVEGKLEQNYKPVRKYYDELFGEITLIQSKLEARSYARVDKVLFNTNGLLTKYLPARTAAKHTLLVPLLHHYSTRVDMCSQTETCIFILEFSSHTLFKEIVNRQQNEQAFTVDDLIQIYRTMADCASILKISNSKEAFSNSKMIYHSPEQLQVVESLLCCRNGLQEEDFGSKEGSFWRDIYVSPESFSLYCRKEYFRAKEMSQTDQSSIFTLAMNFLECALLSDLSEIYEPSISNFNWQKLTMGIQQLGRQYGDDLQKLIESMTNSNPSGRPSMPQIKEYLRIISKNRDIALVEHPFPHFINLDQSGAGKMLTK